MRADGYPHAVWTRLRAEAPVALHRAAGVRAVLGDHEARRHRADRRSSRCASRARRGSMLRRADEQVIRRRRWSSCSIPRGTGRCAASRTRASRDARCGRGSADIERIAVEILDAAAPAGASGEFDFVERIAAPFPIAVIACFLGVPRDDWELAVPLDQRGDRPRRSGVPAPRRDARSDRQARARRAARLFRAPDRAAPEQPRRTTW